YFFQFENNAKLDVITNISTIVKQSINKNIPANDEITGDFADYSLNFYHNYMGLENCYSYNLFRLAQNSDTVNFINYLKDIEYLRTLNYKYNDNSVFYKNLSYPDVNHLPGYFGLNYKSNLPLKGNEPIISQVMDVTYDSDFKPEFFINKLVILGECTATGDVHSVPISKVYPGPEIVATSMDNYLNDGTAFSLLVRKAPWWIDLIIVVIFITITLFAVLKTNNILSNINIFLAILAIFLFFNVLLFILPFIRLWTNAVYPTFFIILTAISTITYKNIVIDKDKNMIKNLFGKFVSPQILESVLQNPDMLSIKEPIKKEMTVLFSDIRDFTTKSEKIPPMELIPQLNEYFTEMVEVIIMKYNGTLDKYMGDAIMAFWGDPVPMEDHAQNAVLAALAMQKHLQLLNEKWEKEGKPPLNIGIGLNSGEMIVGHMGSPRLVDYTVLGDNVNIASRVEGLNKNYGTEIIITESTYELVKDIVDVEFLDSVTVKGKTKTINIYNVVKLKDNVNVNFDNNPTLFLEKGIK
ncbi:MAG: adenylate/guanylate cyclase domain-containing protein, partial [Vampirovibrionia bacterium]